MLAYFDKTKKLIDELFSKAKGKPRCEYVRRDDLGWPFCGKGLENGAEPTTERRAVCDAASLQVWCLSRNNKRKCIWYQEILEFTQSL